MKRIRIFARFLLVFMLSVYILPFTALTARAEEADKNKEFLKKIAGTYTSTVHIQQGYDNADEYWKAKLKECEESDANGDAHIEDFVLYYALNHIELKVDESGNVSGSSSGSMTITHRVENSNGEYYFDYSLEVSSQIPENTTKKEFTVTGTLHEKYNSKESFAGYSYELLHEIDTVISKPLPSTMVDLSNNYLTIDVSDDKAEMYGRIYFHLDRKKSFTVIAGDYFGHELGYKEESKSGLNESNTKVYWTKDYQGDAPGGIEGGITQNAEENSGEDSGADIPTAIVVGTVGVLGAGAATAAGAAAAGAAGSAAATGAAGSSVGTDSGEIGEDERRKKRYKMYIQKDFGNAIRKGASPVTIRARIAEVSEDGTERDRDDLTAQINYVNGSGIEIHRGVYAGRYCEAVVSIPKDYEGDTADITFTFTGEGGTFNNTVRFRAIGEPDILFADDNGAYSKSSCCLNAIFGDGFTYTRRFWLKDAVTLPSPDAFSVSGASDFDFRFAATETPGVYEVNITNKTSDPGRNDPYWDIFNKKDRRDITFSVIVEGEAEPTEGYVDVTLYPEGISVESRVLQTDNSQPNLKYVSVRSYEKEKGSYGGLDSKWQCSDIKFNLAVMEDEGAVINPPDLEIEVQNLRGADENMDVIARKYKYSEDIMQNGDQYTYYFEPNTTLYEGGYGVQGFKMLMLLPVSISHNGQTYTAEVPLRLMGVPMDPMEEWNKEYEKLKERIRKFSFEEDKEYWLEKLDSLALEPPVSIEELRLVSKCLVRRYMTYWTCQRNADMRDVKFYDFMVSSLEWAKFFGDCAFSLLITVYAGPLADAIISPAKDFFVGAIGEIIAADKFTLDTFDNFEFSKNLAAAGDNIIGNSISFTNYKTALATLGGYFVYASFKNYIVKWNEEGVSDIWGALVGGFSDMTVNVVKAGAGNLLGKWIEKSDIFRQKIAPFITKYTKETQFPNFQAQYNRWQELYGDLALKGADEAATLALTEILNKYLTELVGVGAGKVSEMIDDVVDVDGFITDEGRFYFSTTITLGEEKFKFKLDILKMLETFGTLMCPLGAYLIKTIFGDLPAAPAPINVPKDPPLPEEN